MCNTFPPKKNFKSFLLKLGAIGFKGKKMKIKEGRGGDRRKVRR